MKNNSKFRKQISRVFFIGGIIMLVILKPFSVRAAENIPGIHSSLLKYNAEKNAVPTTLNILSEKDMYDYDNYLQNDAKLVKNNTMNAENDEGNGNVAQVSKMVVWIGVLLCIGMLGFLILF